MALSPGPAVTAAITVLKWGGLAVALLCLFPVAMLTLLIAALAVKATVRHLRALAAFWCRPVRAPHDEVDGGLSGDELDRWARIVAGRKKTTRERAYDNRSEL